MLINDLERAVWAVYGEWKTALANPRVDRSQRLVSWTGYSSHILPETVRPQDIVKLADAGQYTFQVAEDGALLQFYYQCSADGRTIEEAKLAYYAVVDESGGVDEEFDLVREIYGVDLGGVIETRSTVALRLDYQPSAAKGVLHSCCHLHVGGLPNSRIAVKGLPTPKQFVEFVFKMRYPTLFTERRLDAQGVYRQPDRIREMNTPLLKMDDDEVVPLVTHLRIAGA
jgi:hypothetical protein